MVREQGTGLLKWDVIGLSSIVPVLFFPWPAHLWRFGFALRDFVAEKGVKLTILDPAGNSAATINIQSLGESVGDAPIAKHASFGGY